MNFFDAVFQGFIQGLTEFLPVSSSGHLTICQHISGMTDNNLFFSVMLHIGTLAAVLTVYIKLVIRLFSALKSIIVKIFKKQFKWSEMTSDENLAMMIIIGLVPLFLLFLPIPGAGMKIKDLADLFSKDGYFLVVGLSLIATSALLFFSGIKRPKVKVINGKKIKLKPRKKYRVPDAVIVGITQCFAAVFPGLSRSGSTLAASRFRGIDKNTALNYSFLLGTPAIVAGALLETKDVIFSPEGIKDINFFYVIVGMIISAVVGFVAIKLFKWLLKTDKMIIFVIYTAAVGFMIVIIGAIETAAGHNIFTGMPLNY